MTHAVRTGAETPVSAAVPDIESLRRSLDAVDYLADDGLATALFLSLRLPQPLLLEGEAGVGKTEAAKALAAALGTELIRLQCYEGIDSSEALYEWNYPRQLLRIRSSEASGRQFEEEELFGAGVPDAPPTAAGDRAPRADAGGPPGRRAGPSRRRLRGIPLRDARGIQRHDPRDRHDSGDAPRR